MKYLKMFEKVYQKQPSPKVGDYVIIDYNEYQITNNIINSKIGHITKKFDEKYDIYIELNDNELKIMKNWHTLWNFKGNIFLLTIYKNNIIYWSDNKEELEVILQSNKYNI